MSHGCRCFYILLVCFSVKYCTWKTTSYKRLAVCLKAPKMFHNLTDNCKVNPNGKLITLYPQWKMYRTVWWRAVAGCHLHCTGRNYSSLHIQYINKRMGQAEEERIKERYCWQQADKKVIKAVRNSDKIQKEKRTREKQTEELVFCPLPSFWSLYKRNKMVILCWIIHLQSTEQGRKPPF